MIFTNQSLDFYNVEWDRPSPTSDGSMPAGNGEMGLNLWVEPGGDLLFYLSKTDALDENNRLVKLGRVRVSFSPNPFAEGLPFRQALHLAEGTIWVTAGPVRLRLWVDANTPQVHLEMDALEPVNITARVELLRPSRRRLQGQELHSAYDLRDALRKVWCEADTLFDIPNGAVAWAHVNPTSIWRESLELQGLGDLAEQGRDPLLGRAFGVWMEGAGAQWVTAGPDAIVTRQPVLSARLFCVALTAQVEKPAQWLEAVRGLRDSLATPDLQSAWKAHTAWWSDFWKRSWIWVEGDSGAEAVTRGYLLQRYLTACAGRGSLPIKFSGSIFTFDYKSEMWNGQQMVPENFGADYRRWGGPFWFQNTRLIYHPLLRAGDFDMLAPFFDFYAATLPLARERTRRWYGHAGVFFPETMDAWGTYANSDYGWERNNLLTGQPVNPHIAYLWSGGLELAAFMLNAYDFTGDQDFLRHRALPLANQVLAFYAAHYPQRHGRLALEHAQSLETCWDVTNPAPDIAGLRAVISRLLALPGDVVASEERAAWERLQAVLPDLPMQAGRLTPAEIYRTETHNVENPELYAIFPFRLYGMGRPDLDLARRTFAARQFQATGGWRQDAIQAAELGLAADARRMVVENFTSRDPKVRFPAFWGPNYDWVPDQDHGGVSMLALQSMLLQWAGDQVFLFPAWPKVWDVSFRLHAPRRTVAEGTLQGGRLTSLTVIPPERRASITIFDLQ